MARLLELWCRGTTTSELRAWLTPMLRDAGFEGPLLTSTTEADAALGGWGQLRLGSDEVYASLGRRTEGCVVFSLCGGFDAVGDRACLALWNALLRDPPSWVGECILQAATMDVYPLLIHSFNRLKPLGLVKVDDDGGQQRFGPKDAAYWEEMGPRLHFIADALFAQAPTPMSVADSLGARMESVPGGVVFDCGWTSRRAQ